MWKIKWIKQQTLNFLGLEIGCINIHMTVSKEEENLHKWCFKCCPEVSLEIKQHVAHFGGTESGLYISYIYIICLLYLKRSCEKKPQKDDLIKYLISHHEWFSVSQMSYQYGFWVIILSIPFCF